MTKFKRPTGRRVATSADSAKQYDRVQVLIRVLGPGGSQRVGTRSRAFTLANTSVDEVHQAVMKALLGEGR